jgi:predicted DNA-binding transcriptional regulator AlpA
MIDKLLTQNDILEIFQISRTALWRWRRENRFPKPKQIGSRLYWPESKIKAFIEGEEQKN